jgi:tetratricopeptide (TPR) repeat protein/transcriptional regulator with XRE-family HTH domain
MPHSEDGSRFGELLRTLRIGLGLSQEELAKRSGLAGRTIARLEQGHSQRPHPESARRLAEALELRDAERADFMACAGWRQIAPGESGPCGSDPSDGLADQKAGAGAAEAAASTSGDHFSPGAGSGPPVPRQLPPGVPHFTGRKAQLDVLTSLLNALGAPDGVGAVVISAIGGTAGVGKTALAVHWAHRVAASLPDGQLYVNLRGFGPSAPMSPAEAVSGFLAALGVPPERWPPGFDAQVGLYRSLAAGRRLLIVLDNARDVEQVRPLLPGAPGCLVLVTSRASLTGLAVTQGAHLITLDVLPDEEARQLLDRRISSTRVVAEPDAVNELVRLCTGLPLALAIVAARACARPGVPLTVLAAELADESRRLDALDAGDPASSVRAVISWSYQSLTDQTARMFRVLGLHPGPDVTVPAAASAAGLSPVAAHRYLRELTHASLLTEHWPGRFGFHDLLRAYAAEQAIATESHQARHEVTGRLLDHYLHTAFDAAFLISPGRDPITVSPPRPGVTPEHLVGDQQALGWMQAEHQVLLAAATLAAGSGFDVHAWQIPWTTAPYLELRGHWHDMATTQGTALAAAKRLSDTAGQAASSRLLALACARLGDHDQAFARYNAALRLYQQLGDRLGEAKVHHSLGVLAESQGRHADALSHAEQALRLYQATGNAGGEASVLNNVGYYRALLGDYQQARLICRQALSLHAQLGLRNAEAHAWDSLGYAEQHLRNFAEATACYHRALSIFRDFGDRYHEATTLVHLGETRHACGEQQQARQAWQQALDILNELDQLDHPDADKVRAKLVSTEK